jgi:CRISPR-associated protein Csd1
MLDTNVVFRLDGDDRLLHERDAARKLLAGRAGGDGPKNFCLITGVDAPVRRLHPTIKGVEGAQSSGAALVSFNLDAFTSYGKEQGDNAPTSEAAAFRYGAALNRMLDRGGPNRLPRPVGDATVVFWADASGAGENATKAAEELFASWLDPRADAQDPDKLAHDAGESAKLRDTLSEIAAGRPLKAIDPRLEDGVRFHVLGLAPNAAQRTTYHLENQAIPAGDARWLEKNLRISPGSREQAAYPRSFNALHRRGRPLTGVRIETL